MFAARDQENMVHGHQQLAAAKPLNQGTRGLQPKTPGSRYPKTPLKIPLNDENAVGGLGGRSGKGKGLENLVVGGKKATFDQSSFVTPMGPRVRAPLGAKTTNAKAKAFQTPAGPAPTKDFDKTQQQQVSARKPRKVVHADSVKLEIHGDESPLRVDRDVEYAPPAPVDLPYESDDFPLGCLNYEPLRKGNLTRGIYQAYHVKAHNDNESELDRRMVESARKADEAILRSLDEEWVVGDVPETFPNRSTKPTSQNIQQILLKTGNSSTIKAPPTVASRRAVSALGLQSRPSPTAVTTKVSTQPRPMTSFLSRAKPVTTEQPSTMRHNAAIAGSRSTIGYSKGRSTSGSSALSGVPNSSMRSTSSLSQAPTLTSTIGYSKGRSASGVVATQRRQGGMTRSVSNLSQSSDVTITPARFAQHEELESKRMPWLSAFDTNDDDIEPALKGGALDCLKSLEDEDEEFVMTLGA